MPLSPEQRTQRARKAASTRWARTAPEQRDEQLRAVRAARHNLDAYVRAIVDRAPELSDEQRSRLATLLQPICQAGARAA